MTERVAMIGALAGLFLLPSHAATVRAAENPLLGAWHFVR